MPDEKWRIILHCVVNEGERAVEHFQIEGLHPLAVEWPGKIAAWLPDNALHLALGIASHGRHTIRLR